MLQFIKKHKIIFLVTLIIIIGGGYYGYTKFFGGSEQVSYITSTVEKGTIVTSVSSSGQISSSNQVDITPKVSGDITKISVISGQEVKAGELIAQIDATDAYKTVRDAQANLQSAQLSLDKLKQSITASSITQAKNSVTSAQTTR
jgi:multidrug efflux pump subunit AcrA (membrane-fusion protein)